LGPYADLMIFSVKYTQIIISIIDMVLDDVVE